MLLFSLWAWCDEAVEYVGSETCSDCHDEQYSAYLEDSKKAHSWKSVERMKSNLKPEELPSCYECHTTGYGSPGGFVSMEETPGLANVGCETCHGPGGLHVETMEAADISRSPDVDVCMRCHNSERTHVFNFKPLRFSGAH